MLTLVIQNGFCKGIDFVHECFLESFVVSWTIPLALSDGPEEDVKKSYSRRLGPYSVNISDFGPRQSGISENVSFRPFCRPSELIPASLRVLFSSLDIQTP